MVDYRTTGEAFDACSSKERWDTMFQRLLEYRFENGHWFVPVNYPKDPQLGLWVLEQRCNRSSLSKDKENKLIHIGFEWNDPVLSDAAKVTERQMNLASPSLQFPSSCLVTPTEAVTLSQVEAENDQQRLLIDNIISRLQSRELMQQQQQHNIVESSKLEKKCFTTSLFQPSSGKECAAKFTPLPLDFVPSVEDVICGKGKKYFSHPGNQNFRSLVAARAEEYASASKLDRYFIVSSVVNEVCSPNGKNRVGGFVRKDTKTCRWVKLGSGAVRLKTSYAFWDALKGHGSTDSNSSCSDSSCKRSSLSSSLVSSSNNRNSVLLECRSQTHDHEQPSRLHTIAMTTTATIGNKNNINKGLDRLSPQLPIDFVPGEHDIIVESGNKNFHHAGNKRFRKKIADKMIQYSNTKSKYGKSFIVSSIIAVVRRESPNGGFVKKDSKTGRWFEIGDFLAREKTSQALRNVMGNYRSSSIVKRRLNQARKQALPATNLLLSYPLDEIKD